MRISANPGSTLSNVVEGEVRHDERIVISQKELDTIRRAEWILRRWYENRLPTVKRTKSEEMDERTSSGWSTRRDLFVLQALLSRLRIQLIPL